MDVRTHLKEVGDSFVRLNDSARFMIEPENVGRSFEARSHRAQFIALRDKQTYAIIIEFPQSYDGHLGDPDAVAAFISDKLVNVRENEIAPTLWDYPAPICGVAP